MDEPTLLNITTMSFRTTGFGFEVRDNGLGRRKSKSLVSASHRHIWQETHLYLNTEVESFQTHLVGFRLVRSSV